jgi:hypothetical protein
MKTKQSITVSPYLVMPFFNEKQLVIIGPLPRGDETERTGILRLSDNPDGTFNFYAVNVPVLRPNATNNRSLISEETLHSMTWDAAKNRFEAYWMS